MLLSSLEIVINKKKIRSFSDNDMIIFCLKEPSNNFLRVNYFYYEDKKGRGKVRPSQG